MPPDSVSVHLSCPTICHSQDLFFSVFVFKSGVKSTGHFKAESLISKLFSGLLNYLLAITHLKKASFLGEFEKFHCTDLREQVWEWERDRQRNTCIVVRMKNHSDMQQLVNKHSQFVGMHNCSRGNTSGPSTPLPSSTVV